LSTNTLNYIKSYQTIYKQVISDAKIGYNDKFILTSTNPTKAMWQLINMETGNFSKINHKIVLKKGAKIVTKPQHTAEQFDAFFVDSVENLVVLNNHSNVDELLKLI
jgi:hypothetical protein